MRKTAIILAAGLGSRLKPLTETEHKCMTKVGGMPIIQRTLENLESFDVKEVIIVVGYLHEKLMQQIKDMKVGMDIQFVVNPDYKNSNTILSLNYGLESINREFDFLYVIEGDVVFEKKVLQRADESRYKNVSILEPYNENLEGTFVTLGKDARIIDWRHKSDQEDGYVLTDKYKTVNIHKFSVAFVRNSLMPEVESYIEKNGVMQPMEKVMRSIVTMGNTPIYGEVLRGEKWYEVDDVNDLKKAEEIMGKM